MIKKVVSEYVEKVDPAMKGVLNEIDIGYIDKESATTLKQFFLISACGTVRF